MTISSKGDLTVQDLAALGFDALVYAIGAQGTKYLGVEGERLPGVYHAKDLVYHYNRLPPFSERPFPMGRRVAIVGVGNVMVDIANYCAHFADCDEIVAIARRGPFEKAYDDREFEDVEDAFDHALYREEIERIRPRLVAAGQNPTSCSPRSRPSPSRRRGPAPACASASWPRPKRVLAEGAAWPGSRWRRTGSSARATASLRSAPARPRSSRPTPWCSRWATGWTRTRVSRTRTGSTSRCPATIRPRPTRCSIPAAGKARSRAIFVVGWARRASDGVVGRARLDAETGIKHVAGYLARPGRSGLRRREPSGPSKSLRQHARRAGRRRRGLPAGAAARGGGEGARRRTRWRSSSSAAIARCWTRSER